jgi:activator of HSP90 ATPase
MSHPIQQTVTFNASPHDVYELLMDSAKHAAFSGDSASISREVGGEISAYDGWITGRNLKLIPDREIVQSWRAAEWPGGHFSRVTFVLLPIPGGTRLNSPRRLPDGTETSLPRAGSTPLGPDEGRPAT